MVKLQSATRYARRASTIGSARVAVSMSKMYQSFRYHYHYSCSCYYYYYYYYYDNNTVGVIGQVLSSFDKDESQDL